MTLKSLKTLVTAPAAEFLKSRGFRKSGLNFSKVYSGVTLLVGFQSSTGSSQESLKITCNLGIRVDRLSNSSGMSVWDTHWRKRIGVFLSDPHDHWWVCTSDEDASKAGREIASLLESQAVPEMERLASPQSLIALWSSGQSPGLTERQRVNFLSQLSASV